MKMPNFLASAGDSVFDVQKWEGPAILKIKYIGRGNFAVRNYPANSNGHDYYDLLVNTIGAYEGTVPLDFKEGEQTARNEIASYTGTNILDSSTFGINCSRDRPLVSRTKDKVKIIQCPTRPGSCDTPWHRQAGVRRTAFPDLR